MSLLLVSDDGDLVRLQALGRLTSPGTTAEADPMRLLVGGHGYSRRVLLDLEQAEFIDSSGIGWLLACHKRFKNAGGILVLHNVPEGFLMTFKMLKLHNIFCLAADVAQAERMALADILDKSKRAAT